jgi:hypothetical protein
LMDHVQSEEKDQMRDAIRELRDAVGLEAKVGAEDQA